MTRRRYEPPLALLITLALAAFFLTAALLEPHMPAPPATELTWETP